MPDAVTARVSRDYQALLNEDDHIMSMDEIVDNAAGVDGIICASGDPFNAEFFQRLPASVRIIATYSVGYEHIDLDAASSRNVIVSNTPDVLTEATADIAMLCLLGAARRASEADRLVRARQWQGWYSTMMLGTHLGGKVLGIFGMGRIGRAVAQRARGFGMQIHYYNRSRLSDDLAQGAVYHDSLESLLKVSQFLSINAPSGPNTLGIINAERIALLPDGAVIANTARGNLVNDDDLIAALQSGKIAAAGLDVYANEPALDSRYLTLDNTLLLPHIGSATVETRDAMGFCCLDNLDAFFAGNPMPSPLT
jgi:lactate dehydrogenase-like 2-hydroxyacid dehydrogenase